MWWLTGKWLWTLSQSISHINNNNDSYELGIQCHERKIESESEDEQVCHCEWLTKLETKAE